MMFTVRYRDRDGYSGVRNVEADTEGEAVDSLKAIKVEFAPITILEIACVEGGRP